MSAPVVEEKVALKGGVEASVCGDQLSLVGAELDAVPHDLPLYAKGIKNALDHIDAFSAELTSLVLDNNNLPSDVRLPSLPHLTTLWVNNNKIADLDLFLLHVRASCPALTYLSMLKNAACPNFFTGKDSDDYHRYRRHVLSFFPQLRFLDASPVSEQERAAAAAAAAKSLRNSAPSAHTAASPKAVKPRSAGAVAIGSSPADALHHALPADDSSSSSSNDDSNGADADSAQLNIAPEQGLDRLPSRDQNDLHAAFGVSTYTYVGKASEGNRFISNNEL